MTPTQLKNDLKLIEQAVNKLPAEAASTKAVLADLIEWQRGFVKSYEDLDVRTGATEMAVEDLLEETAEGISKQSAQILLIQLEQSRNINQTFRTLVQSEKNPLDDVTTRQVIALLKNSDQQISTATALVQDLIFEEEGEDDGDDDGDDDDDGERAGASDDEDADADDGEKSAEQPAAATAKGG